MVAIDTVEPQTAQQLLAIQALLEQVPVILEIEKGSYTVILDNLLYFFFVEGARANYGVEVLLLILDFLRKKLLQKSAILLLKQSIASCERRAFISLLRHSIPCLLTQYHMPI